MRYKICNLMWLAEDQDNARWGLCTMSLSGERVGEKEGKSEGVGGGRQENNGLRGRQASKYADRQAAMQTYMQA